ncbi:MAG: PAS domain-containing hybrid sensor histidine kinase/response regulator [Bacteroidales bacterium]
MVLDPMFLGYSQIDSLPQPIKGEITSEGEVWLVWGNSFRSFSLRDVLSGLPSSVRWLLFRKYVLLKEKSVTETFVSFSLPAEENSLRVYGLKMSRPVDSDKIFLDGWMLPSWVALELMLGLFRNFRFVFTQTGKNVLLIGSGGSIAEIVAWSPEDVGMIAGVRRKMPLSKTPASFRPLAEFILGCKDQAFTRKEIWIDKSRLFIGSLIFLQGNPLTGEGLALAIFSRPVEAMQMQHRIESAERLYQQLFELSPAGMLLEDTRGIILDANQALLDATGYSLEEIKGKHVSILAAPENLAYVEENIRRIISGEKLDVIVESRRKDGSKFYSRLIETLITLSDGSQAILSISSDITDRVQMQRQLEEEKEKYRRFFENVLDIFFISTPDGVMHHVSPSIEKYLGYTSDDLRDINLSKLYYNNSDREEFIKLLKEHKEVIDREIRLITKAGEVKYFSLNAHGIYKEDGALVEIEGSIRDITDKKKYLAELEDARRKAEESAALKSSLLSNMSHEVRTPLNSILGFSQMLSHNHPDPAVKEIVQKIHASGERLLKTLESIMLVAQLDSGLRPEPDNWELSQALARVFLEYQSVAQEKGLLYLLEAEDDLWVYTDEKLLSICVKELIDNAVKFTKEGGVTLRLKAIQSSNGPMARIEIRDTGIGIHPSKHELIFKEFRQASEGMSRSFEGLGLGLSIVRRLVHLLGGTLTFESSPGYGSVFYLDLPRLVHEDKEVEITPAVLQSIPPIYIPEGLLVEDNAINAEITQSFLEGVCTLDVVPNYFDAARLIKYKKYDFFLIDIALGPGPSGIELLKEIRAIDIFRNTPAVAVTGFAQHGDASKLKALGFSHYIAKPFTRDEIISLINTIFQK